MVAAAQNGEEALRLVQEVKPDLLILDINMPKMARWEVVHQLQSLNASVRVLVLSAHLDVDADYENHALKNSASAYVPKGNIQMLTNTLRQLFKE